MAIQRETITVTGAAGGAGAATANASTARIVQGHIVAVYVAYTDSPPAGTTDVTIVEKTNSPAVSILTISNAATDGWFYPRAAAVNQSNTAITNSSERIAVNDYIKATIAQANDADGCVVTVVYDDGR